MTDLLRKQVDLQERELDLIRAIDRVRDSMMTPKRMIQEVVSMISDAVSADGNALYLIDRETGEYEIHESLASKEILTRITSQWINTLADRVLVNGGIALWSQKDDEELTQKVLGDFKQLAAVMVALSSRPLGILLLTRREITFDSDDIALLKVGESQLDSAVIQSCNQYELEQRIKELKTIYEIDRIRDQHLSFEDMLDQVVNELSSVIVAETGFIMLYNRANHQLEMHQTSLKNESLMASLATIQEVSDECINRAVLVCKNGIGLNPRAIMCVPLILGRDIIGVFGVVNPMKKSDFDNDDRHLLEAIASQMDTAIFEGLEHMRLRQVLGRSVGAAVMDRLLARSNVDFLKGDRAVITVLYSDIRGSTKLAESMAPELLVGFINDYLGGMTEVILSSQGTLDKFVGDEVMALFGAPVPQEDHAMRAVRAAQEMQEAHAGIMESWTSKGIDTAPIGIGIATGELIVGEMGSSQRTDYTAIGRAANLGARICSVAGPGEILVSTETYNQVSHQVEAERVSGLDFKGIEGESTAYRITRVLDS